MEQTTDKDATVGLQSLNDCLVLTALQDTQQTERRSLAKFTLFAKQAAKDVGIHDDKAWTVEEIAKRAKIDTTTLRRQSDLYPAMWVTFLQVMAEHMKFSELKYQTLEDFLDAYPQFADREDHEQERLMHTANWMVVLLSKVPAAKNKGFILKVATKLVEGWECMYITGSGQSRPTSDRVEIYETEGGVTPRPRRLRFTKRKRRPEGKVPAKKKRVFTQKKPKPRVRRSAPRAPAPAPTLPSVPRAIAPGPIAAPPTPPALSMPYVAPVTPPTPPSFSYSSTTDELEFAEAVWGIPASPIYLPCDKEVYEQHQHVLSVFDEFDLDAVY